MEFNEAQINSIREFSKANKIGKAKVEAFVNGILAHVPRPTGKPASPAMLALREKVRKLAESQQAPFTSKELASLINCSMLEANNALNYLQKRENLVIVTGKRASIPGQRGKPALEWQFVTKQ